MSATAEHTTADDAALERRIVDAALTLGSQRGWDRVHLHEVAAALGIGLAEIAHRFATKDAIAEAWFARADTALLAMPATPGWGRHSPRERLRRAILSWLGALAPHREVAAAMLGYKLQPEHLHLQVQGALRVSRTVQWIREAAWLPAVGWRRELEEAALTAIYLTTFACWLRDDSADAHRSRALLDRLLERAEWLALRLDAAPPAPPAGRPDGRADADGGPGS